MIRNPGADAHDEFLFEESGPVHGVDPRHEAVHDRLDHGHLFFTGFSLFSDHLHGETDDLLEEAGFFQGFEDPGLVGLEEFHFRVGGDFEEHVGIRGDASFDGRAGFIGGLGLGPWDRVR